MSRLALVLLVSLALPLAAQQGRGSILGTVTDISGAAVPAASIHVINTGTNADFTTSTNEVGQFTAPSLPVGAYTVTAEKQGFKKGVRSGITLQVDQRAEVDIHLEVGQTSESIEVVGEAALVDTSSATVGKVVENRRIADLPLNGRNALALVMLTPGVKSQAGPTNSGFVDRGTALSAISINGGPSSMNSFIVDGGNNNSAFLADINVNPTVDAVQEFKVQSNVMSAEFGFTAGGVVNIVTKSGTNDPHGSLYYFARNDAFDARNAFAATKSPFRYHQYGGTIGGPVVLPKIYNGKDKTFFFFNYEGWQNRRFASNILTVPIEEQRNGNFSNLRDASGKLIQLYDPSTTKANPSGSGFVRDPLANNIIPTSRLDPVSQKMMQFYPLPNRTPTNAYTFANNWIGQVQEERHMNQWTAKGDHRFNDKNTLSGRWAYYKHFNNNGFAGSLPDPNVRQRLDNYLNYNGVISDTHSFTPTMLNEFRVSAARQAFPFTAYSYGQDWPSKLGLPASVPGDTLPRVDNGLPGFGAFTVGLRGSTTWQFVDSLTKIMGSHTMKFGVDFRLQQANNYQREVPSGQFNFAAGLTQNPQSPVGTGSSFATFLFGSVSSASLIRYGGESEKAYSTSFFFQDDWKMSRKLTVNLGLRYDYQQWPRERNNGTSNFNPFVVNSLTGLPGAIQYAGVDYGSTFLDPIYTNFGPRVGFAYDVFGTGKTVVRGGYAIFYPQTFYRDSFGNTAGFANTSTAYNPANGNSNLAAFQFKDGFPTPAIEPLGPKLGPSAFLGQGVSWDQGGQKVPMSQQWTISLQQQLPGKWMVDAAYTANKGTNYYASAYDYNQLDPQYNSLGLSLQDQVPNPYVGKVSGSLGGNTITRSQSLKPFPYYTGVSVRLPHLGGSNYHALLMTAERRLDNGFAILASYTFGKLISDSEVVPSNFGAVEVGSDNGYQNGKYNRKAERSLDPTDVSQRLVLSGIYELPFGKGKRWNSSNGFTERLMGGWQLNVISTMQGGLPLAVRGANNFLANRPNSTGVSAKLDNPTSDRWFDTTAFINPPNFTYGNVSRTMPDVRGPGIINFDLSMIKDTRIAERLRLQFRAEAFNFLNHRNLGNPNVSFSPGSNGLNISSTFGVITSARDPRIMQFGLKLMF
ncbi:carboxypeptidase regulatory-like domain-containing protein [uncultured Paludibaculum sp.]|uniref:TonB-dependent receptor n=1 Tax=uncultured Paludibaculum sp. TaxID=1765020 RepID=UPI002AAB1F44|nr:carboxypeptidase regulatory-like domain-containing protein [uncultured Paludibaculum sp.]